MPFVSNTKSRDSEWDLTDDGFGRYGASQVQLAVLMDIRRELQRIRAVATCHNAVRIPTILDNVLRRLEAVEKNTKKRAYKRKQQ